ncbi:MAG TPA: hypothetical protein VFQ38_02060 [Longimicrobiales bacterium]|nr:hypothetical protein [Longimicrobiales bacterium]
MGAAAGVGIERAVPWDGEAGRSRPGRDDAAAEASRERRVALLAGFGRSLAAAIGDFLRMRGFSACEAPTVESGVRLLDQASPDLVVVSGRDVEPEAVARLRAPGSVRPVIVVLLPGPDERVERTYLELGIRRILVMPAGADALSAAIHGRPAADGGAR